MAKLIILLIVLVYLGVTSIRFFRRVEIGEKLTETTVPFSFHVEKEGAGRYKRILIAGDSLAVGVGSTRSEDSIAGRIHVDVPDAEIINSAKSGANLAQVAQQIENLTGRFDLIVVIGGANDIIRFRSYEKAESDAHILIQNAKEKGDRVIWIVSGNIGLAPVWPWPAGSVYAYRTRKYHTVFRSLAEREGIIFIDLFRERADDIFAKDPERYYTQDGLHLSSDGYMVWYEAIKKELF